MSQNVLFEKTQITFIIRKYKNILKTSNYIHSIYYPRLGRKGEKKMIRAVVTVTLKGYKIFRWSLILWRKRCHGVCKSLVGGTQTECCSWLDSGPKYLKVKEVQGQATFKRPQFVRPGEADNCRCWEGGVKKPGKRKKLEKAKSSRRRWNTDK